MKGVLCLWLTLLVAAGAEDTSKRNLGFPFNLVSAIFAGPITPMWVNIPESFSFIAAGGAGVWALKKNDAIYFLEGSYGQAVPNRLDTWKKTSGGLRALSVGKDTLVATNSNQAYTRIGIKSGLEIGTSWKMQRGASIKSICVYDEGTLEWIVLTNKYIYYKPQVDLARPDGNGHWVADSVGRFTFVACGKCATWALDLASKVIFRLYTNLGDQKAWIPLGDETFKHLAAGDKWVVGVTTGGKLKYRAGISDDVPQGEDWKDLAFFGGSVRMADVYKNQLYITTEKFETWTASLA